MLTTDSFSQFHLEKGLLKAVEILGFTQPTPVQQQAIPAILGGKDVMVSAETGSGKTLAFLLPSQNKLLVSEEKAKAIKLLILAPTRELAQQICQECKKLSEFTTLKAALVTGGNDFKKQQNALSGGRTDIIIATPGRVIEHLQQEADYFQQLSILILDEADRMLDMGFSEDVLNIINHCNAQRQTLLFSATLNHPGVQKIAGKILQNPEVITLNTLQDGHANIRQQVILADDHDHKLKLLAWLLKNEPYDKALVFANSRLRAQELYNTMKIKGFRAGLLHGELDQKDRDRIMALYRDGNINILMATNLAARGLDIQGINLVINFDMPKTGITYIHRIGRTGRVDATGTAIALVKSTEWNLMAGIERFLRQSFTPRIIPELAGRYQGPKKLKASGKAAGSKAKKAPAKKTPAKKVKIRERDRKNVGKRRLPSNKNQEDSDLS